MFIQFFELFFSDATLKQFNPNQVYIGPAFKELPQCGIYCGLEEMQMPCQNWWPNFSIEIAMSSNFQSDFVK
jgi:hypothetical protein